MPKRLRSSLVTRANRSGILIIGLVGNCSTASCGTATTLCSSSIHLSELQGAPWSLKLDKIAERDTGSIDDVLMIYFAIFFNFPHSEQSLLCTQSIL